MFLAPAIMGLYRFSMIAYRASISRGEGAPPMTEVAATVPMPVRPLAGGALNTAVAFWFCVTLIGQWVFLYYIVAFYGPAALSGDFEAWNRHPMTSHAFRPGDLVGNIAFGAHVLLAAIIALGGTLQLIPQIRARALPFHRWNGRVFVITAIAAAL